MNKWSIGRQLSGGVASILVISVIMGVYAIFRLAGIEKVTAGLRAQDVPVLQLINADIMSKLFSHIYQTNLAQKNSFSAEVLNLQRANDKMIRKFETFFGKNVDQDLFKRLRVALSEFRASTEQVINYSATNNQAEAMSILANDCIENYQEIKRTLQEISEQSNSNVSTSITDIYDSISSTRTVLLVGMVFSVILSIVIAVSIVQSIRKPLGLLVVSLEKLRMGDFTQRFEWKHQDEFGLVSEGFSRMMDDLAELVKQVQKSGIQVNSSVTEAAANTREQQATSSEIAATTTEIGATAKQITATSHELLNTVNEVTEVTDKTTHLATGGKSSLNRMEEKMRQIMSAAGTVNAKLSILNEKAGNIGKVVVTINKVADQTNLLSLNAAIEAEKAGEYGRGFAVVATEIRRLADQTAVATNDIEQIVEEIQSAVSAGVMGMDKFSEEVRRGVEEVQQVSLQLNEIIQQVQNLLPRFELVGDGMKAQATGAQQIHEALA